MDTSSPLGGMLSGLSGGGMLSGLTGGSGSGGFTPPHRTMSLADAVGGSAVVRVGVLVCAVALLFGCGVVTAARTPRGVAGRHTRATRAALTAVQNGVVWGGVFVAADLFGGPSMTAVMSLMEMPLMDMNAGGGADSWLVSGLLGLFVAGAAGFAGGMVHDGVRGRREGR